MVTNSLEETDRGQFLCGGYFKEHLVGQDKTSDRCVVALALHNSQLERVERAKTTAKPVASYQFFRKRIMCVGHRKDFEDSKGEAGEQLNPERRGRCFRDVSRAHLDGKRGSRFHKGQAGDEHTVLRVVEESQQFVRARFWMVTLYERTGVEEIICHFTARPAPRRSPLTWNQGWRRAAVGFLPTPGQARVHEAAPLPTPCSREFRLP
jgi:hypothetical protein